ncbi:CHASE2 domain-containing protein [Dankookia sp. GCM10030260]|uniref:CHASE2 domain-containing protein n=1 Tax=Dankookia sp. GCM10030260 TaxID=3273390 RepID=UPI00361F28B4
MPDTSDKEGAREDGGSGQQDASTRNRLPAAEPIPKKLNRLAWRASNALGPTLIGRLMICLLHPRWFFSDYDSNPDHRWRNEFTCRLCSRLRSATLAAFALVVVNPFGWQSATLQASRLFYSRLAAVSETPSAAPGIAVLLMDEPAMEALGSHWPPRLDAWTRLLESLRPAQPKAVFIDVVLGVERGSPSDLDDLAGAIDARANQPPGPASPMRVVLAESGRAAAAGHDGMNTRCPERSPRGLARRTAVLEELACAAESLAVIDWPVDADDDRTYPLSACLGRPFKQDDGTVLCLPRTRPTVPSNFLMPVETRLPAVVLATLACEHPDGPKPAWCGRDRRWLQGEEGLTQGYGLQPRWALRADAMQPYVAHPALGTRCTIYRAGAAGWNDRIVQAAILASAVGVPDSWILALGDLIQSPNAPDYQPLLPDFTASEQHWKGHYREPCLPFPVISASAVVSDDQNLAMAARALLQGRFVLIGDATLGSPDRVASPLHATVPGVVLHAVALETLLRLGPDHPRAGQPGSGWVEYLFTVLLIGMATGLAIVRRNWIAPSGSPGGEAWYVPWILRIVMLGLTLAVLWLAYRLDPTGGQLTPADPLKVALLSLSIAAALLSVPVPRQILPDIDSGSPRPAK